MNEIKKEKIEYIIDCPMSLFVLSLFYLIIYILFNMNKIIFCIETYNSCNIICDIDIWFALAVFCIAYMSVYTGLLILSCCIYKKEMEEK